MTTGASIFPGQALFAACLFCVLAAPAAVPARAQSRSITPAPSIHDQTTPADQNKGRALLDTIRSIAIEGDLYFDFQIRLRPKRGAATRIPGRLWTSRNTLGPITRITISPGSPENQRDIIIQNGPNSATWIWPAADAADPAAGAGATPASTPASPEAMFTPLAGTDLTPFELQMPFIHWDDFLYEGLRAAIGRVTHAFRMRPPPGIAAARPDISGVRIYYDEGFRAITVFEILGPGGVVAKTMKLKEFHVVGGQFCLRKAELRNEATGNGTDFDILLTGVKLTLPRDIFSPEKISTPAAPPPLEQLWKTR